VAPAIIADTKTPTTEIREYASRTVRRTPAVGEPDTAVLTAINRESKSAPQAAAERRLARPAPPFSNAQAGQAPCAFGRNRFGIRAIVHAYARTTQNAVQGHIVEWMAFVSQTPVIERVIWSTMPIMTAQTSVSLPRPAQEAQATPVSETGNAPVGNSGSASPTHRAHPVDTAQCCAGPGKEPVRETRAVST